MAFEDLKEHTENIQDHAKGYFETSIKYYKLKSFKLLMKSISLAVKFIGILLCLVMVLLFCSIAGAFAIGDYLNNTALGFLIVGGIYFLISLLLFSARDKLIEGTVLAKFSDIFFND